MTELTDKQRDVSSWAVGGVVFAAIMLVMIGVFQFFEGLAAIIDDDFYVQLQNYTYDFDTTAWGWIHLILGALLVIVGLALFAANRAAAFAAILLASLSAISNFFFIPYFPIWALVLIALAVYVIWAITRSGLLEP